MGYYPPVEPVQGEGYIHSKHIQLFVAELTNSLDLQWKAKHGDLCSYLAAYLNEPSIALNQWLDSGCHDDIAITLLSGEVLKLPSYLYTEGAKDSLYCITVDTEQLLRDLKHQYLYLTTEWWQPGFLELRQIEPRYGIGRQQSS